MIPAADRRNPPFLSFEESHLPNVFMPLEFVLVFYKYGLQKPRVKLL